MQAIRWQINVCQNSSAAQLHQAGSQVDILQWLKALSIVKFVSMGPLAAVNGLLTSVFAIAALSSCTS